MFMTCDAPTATSTCAAAANLTAQLTVTHNNIDNLLILLMMIDSHANPAAAISTTSNYC